VKKVNITVVFPGRESAGPDHPEARAMIERNGAFIHPTAIVEDDVEIGPGTRIWHMAHIRRGARIGANCTLSKDVYVDIGVSIGDRVKIQNGVSVYHGVTLESDVFVGPHAAFTNDDTPRAFNDSWKVTPTMVRRGASIGANSTIVCGVTLGPYSMVGAGSTVTNDVPPHSLAIGSPARLVAHLCRRGHRLKATEVHDYSTVYQCWECREQLTVGHVLEEIAADRRHTIDRRQPMLQAKAG
jgi:UDP-2-acetamido-3-amino-2,3-dideoxy-glucuronate N-acetyltransferase